MNKTMTSLIAMGIGATAVYGIVQRNNGMTKRMRKGMRKMTRALF